MALPFVVSSQSIKLQLDARIKELTASRISYQGEPVLSFTPFLGVELSDVILAGEKQSAEEPDLLRIEKLQFSLKILPLIFGKTRFSDLKLIRPKFNLLVHQDGSTNWAKIDKEIDALQKPVEADPADTENSTEQKTFDQKPVAASPVNNIKLGRFEIIDGIVDSNIAGNSSAFRVSNLQANINWPTISSAWKISGKGVWRGETFDFSNRTEYPLALFTSGKSALKVDFSSPTLIASFDGQATMLSDIQLHGEASIATPSLPRLFELFLGDNAIERPPFGKFLVRGQVSANAQEVRFDKADIELDSNVATGNLLLHWNTENRPKVSGTLAFSSIDVTPLIEIVSNKNQPKPASGEAAVSQNLIDFDVRFSAQNYKFRDISFGALAATAMANNDGWTFDIGEADFFDGMIVATISSKIVERVREIEMKGILRNVSVGKIASEWYGGEIVTTGNADVNFDLNAPGNARLDDFRRFSGDMKVTITNGQLEGVDLVKAIPALIKNNGFVTVDEIKGVTPFSNLSLDILINNGVGWIIKGNANGDNNAFRLSGKADLLRGGLAIYADISQNIDGEKKPRLTRIFIGGTLKNPLVTSSSLTGILPDEELQ